ncbi:MAG: EVE domain-containing protein [SAR324 cluster bacterium]|nr:EVE domain-containing protein [SAR324 cluster bacterium]
MKFEHEFEKPIMLPELREIKGLENMLLLRKGMRLSIQPVQEDEFNIILKHAGIQP